MKSVNIDKVNFIDSLTKEAEDAVHITRKHEAAV